MAGGVLFFKCHGPALKVSSFSQPTLSLNDFNFIYAEIACLE